jgi:hypothetical protein
LLPRAPEHPAGVAPLDDWGRRDGGVEEKAPPSMII